MLKVRVGCPVCGQSIGAKSLEGHLEKVHELTGVVTLRLHPTSSYRHEPEAKELELAPKGAEGEQGGEAEGEQGGGAEQDQEPEPEAKTEPETAPKTEPEAEPAPETKPKKSGKKSGP